MEYSVFNQTPNNALTEPMFFGQSVNVSRYDQQKYPIFEKLIEKQLSFFWRPEEIDVSKDRIDFAGLTTAEQHIFLSNLKYQTLLDSVQGRSPNVVFLPIVSLPELETWIETWSFYETIHSRSYTHIIRNLVNDPSVIFDDIVVNEEILKRAGSVAQYYDDLYNSYLDYVGNPNTTVTLKELKKKLYLCMVAVNVLEGIRFYVSFACSFAYAERKLMEGNAKIIRLIARDEALHLSATQHIINIMKSCNDDVELGTQTLLCHDEVVGIFRDAAEQEKQWASYLFKDGSMVGLNEAILCEYVEYITNVRAAAIGLDPLFPKATNNPIPWINSWLNSDNVQYAPQEVEQVSYLTSQIDATVDIDYFADMEI